MYLFIKYHGYSSRVYSPPSFSIGAGFFNRISALEARAKRHFKISQVLYLPVIFVLYGMLLGIEYMQLDY